MTSKHRTSTHDHRRRILGFQDGISGFVRLAEKAVHGSKTGKQGVS